MGTKKVDYSKINSKKVNVDSLRKSIRDKEKIGRNNKSVKK